MSPVMFFFFTVAITLAAWLLHRMRQRRTGGDLVKLAGELGLQYCPADRFLLGRRVAQAFPILGAADVSVCDVMYGRRDSGSSYIVTVQYTEGVLGTKHRRRRVGLLMERNGEIVGPIVLARADAALAEQYRELAGRAG